jgi:pimeloyl-ACP methyl ester carboxylesterase
VKFLAKSLHVSILAYDYTGYGLSQPSIPSEENCYADIDAAYDYLVNERQILPENIVLYGRSLGSGPSCYLAARTAEAGSPVAGLILHAPFLSVFRVVFESGCTLIGDKFPNVDVAPYIRYDLFFISLLPIFESITPNCLFCIFLHIHHPSCQGALYL